MQNLHPFADTGVDQLETSSSRHLLQGEYYYGYHNYHEGGAAAAAAAASGGNGASASAVATSGMNQTRSFAQTKLLYNDYMIQRCDVCLTSTILIQFVSLHALPSILSP